MRIQIKEIVNSKTAIAYDDGKKCLAKVLKALDDGEDVILDFQEVDFVITAFLNPVIGDLIILKGPDIMKKIQIENSTQNIIDKIKIVKTGALLKREDIES